MPATNYAINKFLNYNFGATSYTTPATMYFGLSTVVMDATGAVTEPATADGYARVSYTNDKSTGWTTSTTQSLASKSAVTFGSSSAPWGTMTSVFIADSGTRAAGNVWWYWNLSPTVVIQISTVLSFIAGAITAIES